MTTPPAPGVPGGPEFSSPAGLLGRFPKLYPPVSTARAAVTIVLREGRAGVEVLLIERAANPRDPASGDVALPGGRVDPTDGSLADTAMRELEEEVGIPPADVLETLRFVRTFTARRFGLEVGVFAAELGERAHGPAPRSAVEVAHVFWLPSSHLGRTELVPRLERSGSRLVQATRFEGHVLWGFTRRVLRDFFALPVEDDGGGSPFAPSAGAPRSEAPSEDRGE